MSKWEYSVATYLLLVIVGFIMLPYLLLKAWRRIKWLNRIVNNLLPNEETRQKTKFYRQETIQALEEGDYERVSFLIQQYLDSKAKNKLEGKTWNSQN